MKRFSFINLCAVFPPVLLFADSARSQLTFTDVTDARGFVPVAFEEGLGAGVAAADYDADGFIDLFIPNGPGTADQLYRNAGDGTFVEMASTLGLADLASHRCALWFDYDGDARLDLLIASDHHGAPSAFTLLRQREDGTFKNSTTEAGVSLPIAQFGIHQRAGLAAGDLDRDGDLEFISTIWNGPLHLYWNDGDGTFTDATASALPGAPIEWYHQPVIVDLTNDGWPDIFIAVDFAPNQLWINQQDGTFQEVAASVGADNAMNDMGITIGDYDNDGDWDFYITNIEDNDPQTGLPEHNILMRNDSTPGMLQFTEISMSLSVGNVGWSWGTTFIDADNNRWVDIAVTNGWRAGWWQDDESRLFLSNGGPSPTFSDISATSGFNDADYGSALIGLDFDRDGDLDMAQTIIGGDSKPDDFRLLENDYANSNGTNHYLVVKPRIAVGNTHAIGTKVRVRVGSSVAMQRLITAGTSYLGQEPAEAFFGLGASTSSSLVSVFWPDGTVTSLSNIAANQVLQVTHAGPGDLNADGAIDGNDMVALDPCLLGPLSARSTACFAADLDKSGTVDLFDYAILQRLIH